MEVAREVQVDALHGQDLAAAAARGAALHAEGGAEGGLAQRQARRAPQPREPLGEADARGGLALARRRGGDGGDQDQVALPRPGTRAPEHVR